MTPAASTEINHVLPWSTRLRAFLVRHNHRANSPADMTADRRAIISKTFIPTVHRSLHTSTRTHRARPKRLFVPFPSPSGSQCTRATASASPVYPEVFSFNTQGSLWTSGKVSSSSLVDTIWILRGRENPENTLPKKTPTEN